MTAAGRLAAWLEASNSRRFLLFLFTPLFTIYLVTAQTGLPYHIDPGTNVLTAWKLGTTGSIYLPEYQEFVGDGYFGHLNWLVETDGRVVSKYPPGTALLAAPFYRFSRMPVEGTVRFSDATEIREVVYPEPDYRPGAFAAALTSALAVAVFGLLVRSRVGSTTAATMAVVFGLGTTVWAIASNALWQHGPAIMWMSLGLLAIDRNKYEFSGLAFAGAVLTRPQTAVVAAAVGVAVGISRRSFWPIIRIGAPAGLGMIAYLAYNLGVFGELLPRASGSYLVEGAINSSVYSDLPNLARALFHPGRGLFVYSPFLLLLLLGLRTAWREAPAWARGAALGGALYWIIQLRGNVWDGGDGFFGYRYPIETLAAAAPLLALSWQHWATQRPFRAFMVTRASVVSIAVQSLGAFLY